MAAVASEELAVYIFRLISALKMEAAYSTESFVSTQEVTTVIIRNITPKNITE